MINLKIFDRKFDRGLVGYSPRPIRPLYLELKKEYCPASTKMMNAKNSLNFTAKVIAIVFWTDLCNVIGRDFSKK